MTYYLGKVGRAGARLVTSCKDLYNDVNAAYLTGAIDVIVVRQRDGTLKSTPFHVRFGKLGVLRTGDLKEVEIEVNGSPVDMTMKIDETGKVFFSYNRAREEQVSIDMEYSDSLGDPLPPFRAANPIPTPCSQPLDKPTVSLSLPSSPAVDIELVSSDEMISSSLPYNMEVLSDSAIETGVDVEEMRGLTTLSDTEVEINNDRRSFWDRPSSRRTEHSTKGEVSSQAVTSTSDEDLRERLNRHDAMTTGDRTGFWNSITGMLKRRHSRRFSSVEDGIYLDDIDYDSMDPEELSKFFPATSSLPVEGGASSMPMEGGASSMPVEGGASSTNDPVGSSGLGSSPSFSLSPSHSTGDLHKDAQLKESLNQLISTLDGVGFSLCGGLAQGTITEDTFQNSHIGFADFCSDPVGLLANPSLVVRVDGKYYSWQVAAPLIMSAIVYLQVLPQKTQGKITEKYMPKKNKSFWNFWGRGQKEDEKEPVERAKSEGATPVGSPRKWAQEEGREGGVGLAPPLPGGVARNRELISSDEDGEVRGEEVATRPRQRSLKRNKKVGFTNNLTSEQLESLNLKPGANKVKFSITTKFQGTAKANCTVYLWNYSDKIVVSDIDGTITRSDVAGQVLPLLGMDWTHNGVVELFSAISRNGYKVMYLSARAIGQAGYTKEFLRKIRRGTSCLPDGPLFLFPFSLVKAFKKEVIERRPEEFKIQCLKQIQEIFPKEFQPLHAGFGNKHNDVRSYVNVGIPESRIFTVNHKGILRHETSLTFQSSYSSMTAIVDSQFPPLRCRLPSVCLSVCEDEEETKEEFSTFNYWRTPLDVELPFDLPNV